jgi:uncharacterized BrkB/YihY/UPF0761 family membrane protein
VHATALTRQAAVQAVPAFRASSSFGDVYGWLAGVVALQIWTFLSAVAIFFGAAIAAQLEAVRSGTQTPPRV